MNLGLSVEHFTLLHVALSLIGILAGLVVVAAMIGSRHLEGWTALFLSTTIATSVTGFLFVTEHLLPSHIVGIISLVILAGTLVALYSQHLSGHWRWIYVATSVAALYLNVFVLVVQSFLKIPALHQLAPTQTELPFKLVQGVVLLTFIAVGTLAVRRFHPEKFVTAPRTAAMT